MNDESHHVRLTAPLLLWAARGDCVAQRTRHDRRRGVSGVHLNAHGGASCDGHKDEVHDILCGAPTHSHNDLHRRASRSARRPPQYDVHSNHAADKGVRDGGLNGKDVHHGHDARDDVRRGVCVDYGYGGHDGRDDDRVGEANGGGREHHAPHGLHSDRGHHTRVGGASCPRHCRHPIRHRRNHYLHYPNRLPRHLYVHAPRHPFRCVGDAYGDFGCLDGGLQASRAR